MPRKPDPFKPDEGAVYTNGQVNRAGQLLRRFYAQMPVEKREDAFAGFDVDELIDAMIAVTWWRSLHARPLSRVAANLRYHAAAEEAAVEGRIDVTQRLKRRPTIFDKLEREPTMQLTQMWDIGGVRADFRRCGMSKRSAGDCGRPGRWSGRRTTSRNRDHRLPRQPPHRPPRWATDRGSTPNCPAGCVGQSGRGGQSPAGDGYKFGRGGEDVHDYYRIVSEAFAVLDRDEV